VRRRIEVLGAKAEAWLPKSIPLGLLGIENGSTDSEIAPKHLGQPRTAHRTGDLFG
jgi:hypothetical protein